MARKGWYRTKVNITLCRETNSGRIYLDQLLHELIYGVAICKQSGIGGDVLHASSTAHLTPVSYYMPASNCFGHN